MTKTTGKEICVSIGIKSKGVPQAKLTATHAPLSNDFDLSIAYGAAPHSMNVSKTAFAKDAEYREKSRDIENTCG